MLFFERIAGLEREHASFAIATVVARRSPVSSHLGDRALVFVDGHMEGFVGGSCSRDIVRRYSLEAIVKRRPLLLQIRPDAGSSADGEVSENTAPVNTERVVIPMSCSSEGAVDVYIEPRVPLRRLVVVGFTPVAQALARIAVSLDYDVVRVVTDSELRDLGDAVSGVRVVELKALRSFLATLDERAQRDLVAIVASQGHYDELALEVLLECPLAFAGLLASRRRAASVAGVLGQQGLPAERLAAIHNPVGLDIGARSPGEVAVSILAEIIAHGRRVCDEPAATGPSQQAADEVDPVCGMDVETAGVLHRAEHDGRTFFFCGSHCRAAFAALPAQYLQLGTT
jgi:xanthine dehydrogenase accessory factor